MTDFNERITEEQARAMGIRAFVVKAFAIRDFAEIVRRVLDNNQDCRFQESFKRPLDRAPNYRIPSFR